MTRKLVMLFCLLAALIFGIALWLDYDSFIHMLEAGRDERAVSLTTGVERWMAYLAHSPKSILLLACGAVTLALAVVEGVVLWKVSKKPLREEKS